MPARWSIIFLFLFTGCTHETGTVCFPVKGRILYDRKPLADAMVLFHPLDPDPEAVGLPKPLGYTDQDGEFELTTLKSRDGAPPGEYAITVELRELTQNGDEMVRDGKNLLPDRYRNPGTSKLRYEVVAGDNDVPTLELQSR